MKTKKTGLLVSALALGMLFACSKNEEVSSENAQLGAIEQPSVLNKQCSFVDNNWSSTSVLSSTVVNASETTFIRNENSKIASIWGQSAVALSFVRDPSNPGSTYNAISYGSNPRKIYYGEAIYKAALTKGRLVCSMILAHEFGHQLQYTFGLPSVQESTARPNELEADGFAGYYLRKPAGYNAASFAAIAAGSDFAFAIGDYQTTSAGHHGTPPQRRSAVRLGFLLAAPANGNLTASSFDSNFFYYYNGVLNGTYKMARPANITDEMDAFMQSHMEELRQIQSGEITKEEFKQLGDN
jgi:uncharacterized protein